MVRNTDKIDHVSCPQCSKEVLWNSESKWRPFCSERCRLIDLGEWFEEDHTIASPLEELPPS